MHRCFIGFIPFDRFSDSFFEGYLWYVAELLPCFRDICGEADHLAGPGFFVVDRGRTPREFPNGFCECNNGRAFAVRDVVGVIFHAVETFYGAKDAVDGVVNVREVETLLFSVDHEGFILLRAADEEGNDTLGVIVHPVDVAEPEDHVVQRIAAGVGLDECFPCNFTCGVRTLTVAEVRHVLPVEGCARVAVRFAGGGEEELPYTLPACPLEHIEGGEHIVPRTAGIFDKFVDPRVRCEVDDDVSV